MLERGRERALQGSARGRVLPRKREQAARFGGGTEELHGWRKGGGKKMMQLVQWIRQPCLQVENQKSRGSESREGLFGPAA